MNVDRDLLADYLGGALSGTPEEARVAHLIAEEPAWSAAADQLSGAFTLTRAELDRLPAPTMPEDIAARLDGVLADAPTLAATAAPHLAEAAEHPAAEHPAAEHPAAEHAAAGAASPVTPYAGRSGRRRVEPPRHPPGRPGQRTRRRLGRRVGAGFAAAAGVVAFAAVGVGAWHLADAPMTADDSASAPTAEQPMVGEEAPQPYHADPELVASGRDYQADPRQLTPPSPGEPGPGPQADGDPQTEAEEPTIASDGGPLSAPPPALDRLWSDGQARAGCLDLVVSAVSPAPASVEVLDFARVDGEPALVIWVTAGDGTRWAWAVGPGCGTPAAGVDELFQLRVS